MANTTNIIFGICIVIIIVLIVVNLGVSGVIPVFDIDKVNYDELYKRNNPAYVGIDGACVNDTINIGGYCEKRCPPGYKMNFDKSTGADVGACLPAGNLGTLYDPTTATYKSICPPFTKFQPRGVYGDGVCVSQCKSDQDMLPDGTCKPKCVGDRIWSQALNRCVCDQSRNLKETADGVCVDISEKCPIGFCKRVNYAGDPTTQVCDLVNGSYACILPRDEYFTYRTGPGNADATIVINPSVARCDAPFTVQSLGPGLGLCVGISADDKIESPTIGPHIYYMRPK
jgi:hypothetical protein